MAITVDGPRGPARVAEAGAVWLAGPTGQPILPFHLEADRFWTTRSWDRAQVPKPFSTVAVVLGEPIEVSGVDETAMGTPGPNLGARSRASRPAPASEWWGREGFGQGGTMMTTGR